MVYNCYSIHFDTDYRKQYFWLSGLENLHFILGKPKIVKGTESVVIMHWRILNLPRLLFFHSYLFYRLEDFSLMHVFIQGDNCAISQWAFRFSLGMEDGLQPPFRLGIMRWDEMFFSFKLHFTFVLYAKYGLSFFTRACNCWLLSEGMYYPHEV